jgi:hypothetical protein
LDSSLLSIPDILPLSAYKEGLHPSQVHKIDKRINLTKVSSSMCELLTWKPFKTGKLSSFSAGKLQYEEEIS